ncbi:AbrB/MazE/SpoVT family DNA-binding domain-containing protein [Bacillus toyonensis]|nr:AbrB/MazE/SpoVT family DNA-binding domain-containing protein [Bacillus toyonensis]
MKKTGMIRRLDDLGRVVLPKEMRRTLDIVPRSSIEMFVQDGNVHIRKQEKTCFVTGNISENHMEFYDGRLILSQEGAKDLLKTVQGWVLE